MPVDELLANFVQLGARGRGQNNIIPGVEGFDLGRQAVQIMARLGASRAETVVQGEARWGRALIGDYLPARLVRGRADGLGNLCGPEPKSSCQCVHICGRQVLGVVRQMGQPVGSPLLVIRQGKSHRENIIRFILGPRPEFAPRQQDDGQMALFAQTFAE